MRVRSSSRRAACSTVRRASSLACPEQVSHGHFFQRSMASAVRRPALPDGTGVQVLSGLGYAITFSGVASVRA